MTLNSATGILTGTPAPSAQWYGDVLPIVASNPNGSTGCNLTIMVNPAPPQFAYPSSSYVLVSGQAIIPMVPVSTGGPVWWPWRVAPELPSGLSLDPVFGIVSGTPAYAIPSCVYTVTGSNESGTFSLNVSIEVDQGFAILGQPASLTRYVGESATFQVVCGGTVAPAFQWYRNGQLLSKATSSAFTQPTTVPSDNGAMFQVRVTDLSTGRVLTSASARLTVGFGIFSDLSQPQSTFSVGDMIRLNDGRVLILGYTGLGPYTPAAAIFDPANGAYLPTAALPALQSGHTATLLDSGLVLVAGGYLSPVAYLYDPATGTFSATGSLSVPREYHTATLLADGRVLISGGEAIYGNGNVMSQTAEIYDPSTGQFTLTGPPNGERNQSTATLLTNGDVLLAGGWIQGYNSPAVANAEIFHPATGTFQLTGPMQLARAAACAVLLPDGKVLVAGGSDNNYGSFSSVEVYDPATTTFAPAGSLLGAREGKMAALMPDGTVLFAGGLSELFNPATGASVVTGFVAGRGGTVWPLSGGQVLFMDRSQNTWVYHPNLGPYVPLAYSSLSGYDNQTFKACPTATRSDQTWYSMSGGTGAMSLASDTGCFSGEPGTQGFDAIVTATSASGSSFGTFVGVFRDFP